MSYPENNADLCKAHRYGVQLYYSNIAIRSSVLVKLASLEPQVAHKRMLSAQTFLLILVLKFSSDMYSLVLYRVFSWWNDVQDHKGHYKQSLVGLDTIDL